MNMILIKCLLVILIAMVCLAVRLLFDDLINLLRRLKLSLNPPHDFRFRRHDRSIRQILRALASRLTDLVTAGGPRLVRVCNGHCTEHGIVYGT